MENSSQPFNARETMSNDLSNTTKKKRQRIIRKSEVTVHQWTFSTENR
ncbi:hypothetical protein KIH41_17490 [Litoribacter ruber]|uniref:Uncharacterized protein n=1 Tax=Litoribacter ruber TaxID=702568 RepID=A0AAP2G209_9BACT|nr:MULTISPECIES: hypothetical protein [Litoribacter]MBS9525454.1 hypothetical protein [Litoribacter alkaliphilus]MBT0813086.1 hypothetical protein [Litoribacter ruber]